MAIPCVFRGYSAGDKFLGDRIDAVQQSSLYARACFFMVNVFRRRTFSDSRIEVDRNGLNRNPRKFERRPIQTTVGYVVENGSFQRFR